MLRRFPAELDAAFERAARSWSAERSTERLWRRDASLWTGAGEDLWLGWLEAPEREAARLGLYAELARTAARDGITDVVLLGMGGSSLGAEVLRRSAPPPNPGTPRLHVLDSTHPEQVAAVLETVPPLTTWVVVASKSGSTLEPNLLFAAFFDRFERALGEGAARRFVAVTDPGSALEKEARQRGFLALVPGEPTIGGRFSAISPFGLVPAALLGFRLGELVNRTARLAALCRGETVEENPGVELGLALAVAAEHGRDKVTLVLAPPIASLGAWLEQLVAESTGKQGKAILPIDGEPPQPATRYGGDRLFVAISHAGEYAPHQERFLGELAAAGQPVLSLDCPGALDLGAEFFRWEIATAVAGARLGVNPFDQPDVEAAKVAARRVTAAAEATGELPPERPDFVEDGLELFLAPHDRAFAEAGGGSIAKILDGHFARAGAGDYVALLAFLAMNAENEAAMAELRSRLVRATPVPVTAGFGPRFLHSTGQAHKGGPPTGLFLQITESPAADLPIPDRRLTFGQVVNAQARGDFEVLAERGRRIVRLHFARGAAEGWPALFSLLDRATAGP